MPLLPVIPTKEGSQQLRKSNSCLAVQDVMQLHPKNHQYRILKKLNFKESISPIEKCFFKSCTFTVILFIKLFHINDYTV